MGIYNIIDLKKNCPKCGQKVEWQTKDLVIDRIYPVANVLEVFAINKKMIGEIHTHCNKCKTWSEAKIKDGKLFNLKIEKSKV